MNQTILKITIAMVLWLVLPLAMPWAVAEDLSCQQMVSVDLPKLTARPMEDRDEEAVLDILTDPRVANSNAASSGRVDSREDWLQSWRDYGKQGQYVVELDGKVVSSFAICAVLPEHTIRQQFQASGDEVWAMTGQSIHPDFWGRGIGSRVAEIRKQIAAKDFGVDVLLCDIAPGNLASRRVVEKAGYQYVGRNENAFYYLYRLKPAAL